MNDKHLDARIANALSHPDSKSSAATEPTAPLTDLRPIDHALDKRVADVFRILREDPVLGRVRVKNVACDWLYIDNTEEDGRTDHAFALTVYRLMIDETTKTNNVIMGAPGAT